MVRVAPFLTQGIVSIRFAWVVDDTKFSARVRKRAHARVCSLPHCHTTARTRMYLWEMVGGAPWLWTIGRICSRCTGFVAVTTQHSTKFAMTTTTTTTLLWPFVRDYRYLGEPLPEETFTHSPMGHSVSIQQMAPAQPSQNLMKFAPDVGQTSRWNRAKFYCNMTSSLWDNGLRPDPGNTRFWRFVTVVYFFPNFTTAWTRM